MPSSKDVIQLIQSCKLWIHEHESHTYNSFNTSLAHCRESNCPVHKWTSKPLRGLLVSQLGKRDYAQLPFFLKIAFNYHLKSPRQPSSHHMKIIDQLESKVLRNQIKLRNHPAALNRPSLQDKKTGTANLQASLHRGLCILWTPKTNKDKIIGEWNALSHHKDPFIEGKQR